MISDTYHAGNDIDLMFAKPAFAEILRSEIYGQFFGKHKQPF